MEINELPDKHHHDECGCFQRSGQALLQTKQSLQIKGGTMLKSTDQETQ